ncbi:MAG: hypothetical protein KJ749_04525 [Planctomycetes bacterium]|nr:hypothetical protein [Planctomycetota bacterium]
MNVCAAKYARMIRAGLIVSTLYWGGLLIPPVEAGPGGAEEVDVAALRARLTPIVDRVEQLAGTDDLLDTLHFGWFDRPYARTTLAILVKTTSTLQREVRLRERQSGAIPDGTVAKMLDWAEDAVQRVSAPYETTTFRPHRLRVTGSDLATASPTPALYGMIDCSTATRYDPTFGDLDLAAALGFRLYPRLEREAVSGEPGQSFVERANSLGMATVVITSAPAADDAESVPESVSLSYQSASTGHALFVRPMSLRQILSSADAVSDRPGQTTGLTDPPSGESWASSLARRALARGAFGKDRYVVDGWTAPCGSAGDAADTAAAMWVHALDGQSLGLIRGWRDLRDGSGSPYASLMTTPDRVEAIAYTALDLIRLGKYVAPFRSNPRVAIAVGPDAVDSRDNNRWAAWIEPIWTGLLDRQIDFDVVPLNSNNENLAQRYSAVFPAGAMDAEDRESFFARLDRALAADRDHSRRMVVQEAKGGIAANVFLREGRTPDDRPCIALANLSNQPRQLVLAGKTKLGTVHDVIANVRIANPRKDITLAPWQVRLLWPTD